MNLPTLIAEAVLSARADAIVAADSDGVIRFWNPGAERIFGYTQDEALGRSLDLIIPERLRQRHWEGYRQVMETGHSRYGESDVLAVPALRKDGAAISRMIATTAMRRPLSCSGTIVNSTEIAAPSLRSAGTASTSLSP